MSQASKHSSAPPHRNQSKRESGQQPTSNPESAQGNLPLQDRRHLEPEVRIDIPDLDPAVDQPSEHQALEIDARMAQRDDLELLPSYKPPRRYRPQDPRGSGFWGFIKASLVILILLLVIIGVIIWQGPEAILDLRAASWGDPVEVNIPRGSGIKEIASRLKTAGIIDSYYAFIFAALWTRDDGKIKAGEYSISPAVSLREILLILRRGRVIAYRIPIPEGFTLAQIIERLAANSLVDKSTAWSVARDPAYLASHGIPGETLEGYLFPSTYRFSRGLSAETIFDTMIEQFWKVWQPLKPQARTQGMSMSEAVILASIIEREAVKDSERPMISSVYHNRLDKGMRLQADPTVIYGLDDFKGKLTRSHLKIDTPYNTYTRKGLPPGPICSPGARSLKAAVSPKTSKYYYFVAKGNGYHAFSRTLREHNRNVWRFRRKTKK